MSGFLEKRSPNTYNTSRLILGGPSKFGASSSEQSLLAKRKFPGPGRMEAGPCGITTGGYSVRFSHILADGPIKSIQRGTITKGSTATSATAAISSVNKNNSIILFCGFTTNTDTTASAVMPRIELTNSTTVTIYTNGIGAQIIAGFEVIEFNTGVLKQNAIHGTLTIAGGATVGSAGISEVDKEKSIIVYNGFLTTNLNAPHEESISLLRLADKKSVQAVRAKDYGAGYTVTVGFCVAEFNEGFINSVQHIYDAYPTSGSTHYYGIKTVDTSRSAVFSGRSIDADGDPDVINKSTYLYSSNLVESKLTGIDVIQPKELAFCVAEFTGALVDSVQRGYLTISGTDASASITEADTSLSSLNLSGFYSGVTNTSPTTQYFARITLYDSTTIYAYKTSSSGTNYLSYEVISFKAAPTGPASYTLTANTGSFSLTGQSTGLFKSLRLEAQAASFALTGNAAGFVKGYSFTADSGVFAFNGINASFTRLLVAYIDCGQFSLTCRDINLHIGYSFSVDSQSFSIVGLQNNLLRSLYISSGTGSFSIVGLQNNLLRSLYISSGTGSFSIVGLQVNLNKGIIFQLDGADFVLSCSDILFQRGYSLPIICGQFSFDGAAAGIYRQLSTAAETGLFDIYEYAVLLNFGRLIDAETAAFIFSGNNILLLPSITLDAEHGEFFVSGNDALFSFSISDITTETGYFYFYGVSADVFHTGRSIKSCLSCSSVNDCDIAYANIYKNSLSYGKKYDISLSADRVYSCSSFTDGNMRNIILGNMIRLSGIFTDSSSKRVDPTSITLKVKTPSGNVESYSPTKHSIGMYFYDYVPSSSGKHYFRFESSGDVISADEGWFTVSPTQFN